MSGIAFLWVHFVPIMKDIPEPQTHTHLCAITAKGLFYYIHTNLIKQDIILPYIWQNIIAFPICNTSLLLLVINSCKNCVEKASDTFNRLYVKSVTNVTVTQLKIKSIYRTYSS